MKRRSAARSSAPWSPGGTRWRPPPTASRRSTMRPPARRTSSSSISTCRLGGLEVTGRSVAGARYRSSCCRCARTSPTRSRRSTRGRTTTSRSPSVWASCWRASAPCFAARTRRAIARPRCSATETFGSTWGHAGSSATARTSTDADRVEPPGGVHGRVGQAPHAPMAVGARLGWWVRRRRGGAPRVREPAPEEDRAGSAPPGCDRHRARRRVPLEPSARHRAMITDVPRPARGRGCDAPGRRPGGTARRRRRREALPRRHPRSCGWSDRAAGGAGASGSVGAAGSA